MKSFKTTWVYLLIVTGLTTNVVTERTCSKYQFKCEKDNRCIAFNKLCDGIADCDDVSDETALACENVRCPPNTFQCSYGACINSDSVCNGVQNCVDNSDEMLLKCARVLETSASKEDCLEENQFKCISGECIAKDEVCNGKINCSDSSDESICGNSSNTASITTTTPFPTPTRQMTETFSPMTSTPLPIRNEYCLVPADLSENIQIYYESTGQEITKGTYAAPFSTVTYKCELKYTLEGDANNFCDNGTWTVSNHPKCIKFCPPLTGITTKSKCEFDGETVSCLQPLRPNTTARISCAFGYRKPEDRILTDVLHCDDDGKWDFLPYSCEQICGFEAPEDVSLIIGGEYANITKVPWHVGIYYKYQDKFVYCCGGTILNAKIVIGPAYGFFNFSASKFLDPSNLKVVAGKNFNDFYAMEPLKPQVLNVSQTIYDHQLNMSNFIWAEINSASIVLLVLDDYIKFNSYIKPICLETDLSFQEKSVKSGLIGRVAGWGWISPYNAKYSPALKIIDLPTVDINKCKQESTLSFGLFLTDDKFCAGYTDGQSLCYGDLGGGIVFQKKVQESNLYFLRGFNSILHTDGTNTCDNFRYSAFTNVQYYIEMIKFYLNKTKEGTIACDDTYADNFKICDSTTTTFHKLESTKVSCFVPSDLPDTIKIFYEGMRDQEIPKGSNISSFNGIIYKCKPKYTLRGDSNNFCDNGKWTVPNHPTCVKFCSQLPLSGITIKSKCQINDTAVSCLEPLQPNTTAKIGCAFGYQKPVDRFVIDVIHCDEEGEWDFPTFRCEQICGLEAPESTSLIIGGNLANITKAPWHVGIYSNVLEKERFDQICGGTILNAKVVISAAHCFWNSSANKFFDPSNFKVAAGKYYRDLYATEQLTSQVLNVAEINYKREYNDYEGFFNLDIALLVLVDYIEFKPYIKPICVQNDLTFSEKNVEPGLVGRVAGWGLVASGGESSPELKTIDLPTIDYNECKQKLSNDLKLFITSDKFCAGYTNGQSVCRGDSGGGLVFPKRVNGNEVYFLKGIVSTGGAKAGSCDNDQYTLFTNIQYHIEMITFYESQNTLK